MDLMTWNPLREIDDMFKRGGMRALDRDEWMPVVDIREKKKEYVIRADVPGVNREDIHLTVDKGVLKLSGERRWEHEEKDEKQHRRESYYGQFTRSFSLPDNADGHKIQAKYRDGVVEIRMPKTADNSGAHTEIAIE
ncbi:Hsp20/alpha crystallin family protein [Salinisphaera hydrothermalis]|uniref:Low molecular weight heat shock protein (Hsp17) n=1 Tax=Salinisphaera hydrothermalis (strain C41B8) TaxID=1304275 RepID=A0A084IJ39_SALHC|nr:Hsp20/alpha crystallin family protein [Salinisphaera hydrothermalis]KEZ76723.1 low molecular weight heat shock protein (Hsp17) [Salinisphaera hydrothermalis C41B8]